jgi:hypothetical protein
MAELDERNFEIMKKNMAELVVVLSAVVGFQMAVDGPFSDQRNLVNMGWA